MVFASRTRLTPSVSMSLPTVSSTCKACSLPRSFWGSTITKRSIPALAAGKAGNAGGSARAADTLSTTRPRLSTCITMFRISCRGSSAAGCCYLCAAPSASPACCGAQRSPHGCGYTLVHLSQSLLLQQLIGPERVFCREGRNRFSLIIQAQIVAGPIVQLMQETPHVHAGLLILWLQWQ